MALFTAFHAVMPYCIQKQSSGKWVFLNRGYKPVGFFVNGIVDYDAYPIGIELPGLTPALAKKISHNGEFDGVDIHLYRDGTLPNLSDDDMRDYMRRLKLLGDLRLDTNALPRVPTNS